MMYRKIILVKRRLMIRFARIPESSMIKLFVGGFPLDMDEIEIVKLFAPYGDVSTIKIVRNRQTKICKGYAFLEMLSLDDAERAIIALDGLAMGDRVFTVRVADDKPAVAKRPAPSFRKTGSGYNKGGGSYGSSSSSGYSQNAPVKNKRPRRSI